MTQLPSPDVTRTFPPEYPREMDSVIQRFLAAPQTQFDKLTTEINITLRSLQLPNASGRGLDLIGYSKGPLGIRAHRGDDEYRQFLLALPNSFEGYHREKDIRKAIASGILTDNLDDIDLPEDVVGNTYSVTIHSWQPHSVSLVDSLCSYADGVGIERTGPIRYDWGETPSLGRLADAGIFERTSFGGTGGLNPIPDYSTCVEYEDGFGGFDLDEGYRFDREEPRDISFGDVAPNRTETVPSALSLVAFSRFYVGGDLHINGRLRITGDKDDESSDLILGGRSEIRSSPVEIADKLEIEGEFEVGD